ncbi:unnamed protein product [Merluccius merluccius]
MTSCGASESRTKCTVLDQQVMQWGGGETLSKMAGNLDSILRSNTATRESSSTPHNATGLADQFGESVGVRYPQPAAAARHRASRIAPVTAGS